MSKFFRGVGTAIITPMNEDYSIDYVSFAKLVEFQINSKVDSIIVAGTTGEGSTLTLDEKLKLLEIAKEVRGNRKCKIILGTGSNNTIACIESTKAAAECGVDAVLVVTPYYNKTSQKGLISHYNMIANSVDIPIILYNVPGRTGMTIEPETVLELSKHRNIIGLKDATGDISYLDRLVELLHEEFCLYSGDDPTFFDFLVHGGDGVISVVSNCLPIMFKSIFEDFENGNINLARNTQIIMKPFIQSLFKDISPTPVKAVLSSLGMNKDICRLPLVPTDEDTKNYCVDLYNGLNKYEV